jgi:hypothetical protein
VRVGKLNFSIKFFLYFKSNLQVPKRKGFFSGASKHTDFFDFSTKNMAATVQKIIFDSVTACTFYFVAI